MAIFVDITTSYAERGMLAHGVLRMEREVAGAFARLDRDDIRFVRFSRPHGRYVALSRAQALAIVRYPAVANPRRRQRAMWRSSRLSAAGRRLELWVRTEIRGRWRRRHEAAAARSPDAAGPFAPGDWMIISGQGNLHGFYMLSQLRRRAGLRLAIVIHDLLAVVERGDARASDPARFDIPYTEFLMREADLIFPISRFTASELRRHAAMREARLPPLDIPRMGHRPSEAVPVPMPDIAGRIEPGHFVLCVGPVSVRKNQALLVRVWRDLVRPARAPVLPLVLAGRIDRSAAALGVEIATDPALAGLVHILPETDDAMLTWLYRHCRFTVFPSLAEGFGLPVVESFSFGKACIASDAMSLPEVSQGVGIHIDPADAAQWRETVSSLMHDDAALAAAQAAIASRFVLHDWSGTAADMLAAIERRNADFFDRPDPASVEEA